MKKIVLLFLIFLLGCGNDPKNTNDVQTQGYTQRKDTYPNFEALKSKEVDGIDYKISVYSRATSETIFAIHGGNIDEMTSVIAEQIAQKDLNLYLFEGLKEPHQAIRLHITSHKFDEPQALQLARHSKKCISVHGFRSKENVLCLGGSDKNLRTVISDHLKKKNFEFNIETLCKALEGTHKDNIVNKCADEGVQLEFSSILRKELIQNPDLLKKVSNTIREALFSVSRQKAAKL